MRLATTISQKSLTIGKSRASFNVAGRNGGVSTTINTSIGFLIS
jgi:hypothetical protein